ncbi:ABC transporter ATP-binding protein, partial [Nitratidesulfovibrio liaohensis]|uniref:metal ABC transporter ATP-binding protein n=1 Tax=Nitratidesulfovibrio liaohensis TaxID=2604158 RepID=UPI003132D118
WVARMLAALGTALAGVRMCPLACPHPCLVPGELLAPPGAGRGTCESVSLATVGPAAGRVDAASSADVQCDVVQNGVVHDDTASAGTDPADVAVFLRDVVVSPGGRTILDVSNLTVPVGEFLAVVGPNGAGKSTLLGLVNGFVRPGFMRSGSGAAVVLGRDMCASGAWRVRRRVALVAQMTAVDPRLPISVLETVMTGGYGRLGLLRRPGAALRAQALANMERTGIAHLAQRPFGQCSGGERQRAAIARALTQQPDILLLDEPTSALDWHAQREIMALVTSIHRERAAGAGPPLTTILITHDLNALAPPPGPPGSSGSSDSRNQPGQLGMPGQSGASAVNRVACMAGGRIVWAGPLEQALDAVRLTQLYGTPISVIDHQGRPVVLF